jgi:predicted amidohydrolase
MIKTIGCVQFEVRFGDKPANFAKVEKLIADGSDASFDLLVLPELCFTGYEFKDAKEVAEHAEAAGKGPTSDYLLELASRHNAVVVAGYPEAGSDGRFYNSSLLVTPDGQFSNYRKLHLFSRENDLFSPGDAPPRGVDTPAGRIGMMICFDWFFPETARLLALDGAQIIAHPSNLVLPYCQRAMYARSVENHVYSITANRIGTEERTGRVLTFTGASQVLAVDGMPMATAAADSEEILLVSADISAADNKQLNPYNNLLSSRRTEHYQDLLPMPGTRS